MTRPRVLFLCTANSARSQLAEALLRDRGGDQFEACSAGTDPSSVHPMAIRVLEEAGVDASGLRSKSIEEALAGGPVAHAFAVCAAAADRCPALARAVAEVERWPFEDPAGEGRDEASQLEGFRRARDLIGGRIESWLSLQ